MVASTVCPHPDCGYDEAGRRPYANKRDGIPTVSGIASLLDAGKARSFPWAASGVAATQAVHHTEAWWNLPTAGCTHEPGGFCEACAFIRSQFDREWTAKADLGTHVHHLALSWALGEDVDEDEISRPYLDALERFYQDFQPRWVHLERTVLGTVGGLKYRGTFDAIVDLVDACRALIDIKTGGVWPVEQTIQLAGYKRADWITRWEDGKEILEEKMPKVEDCGCLFLNGDGTYQMLWLPTDPTARVAFDQLLSLHYWQRQTTRWYREFLRRQESLEEEMLDAH